uniref:18S rRNA (guanine(1575)-N(7))-methyltransferase Bud23 C-terminal domain-containing protein n=1 Tax=Bionectria ochroleuca TaxID=29856 RepID=A0A0B7KDD0_BIOOC
MSRPEDTLAADDDPGTKNVKLYLVLTVGGTTSEGKGDITGVVEGMEGVDVMDIRRKPNNLGGGPMKKGSKAWIMQQKGRMERKGRIVKATSKYTGRKRRPVF